MDAPTAGVNHGLFFSVETGMFVRTLSDVVLAERSSLALGGRQRFLGREIERNKRLRADMVRALNKVTELHISEMGELDAMVSRSLDVSERIKSIQTLLELLESELELMYDTNTNRVVNLIAVIGLVFAALQVVVSIPSLFG